ncbi:phloretin 4'-O-glucosyltransferase [Ziziphus jujuba]|uniref:Glycosyltransferase n=1 Tax=Ziziphus jujuba TaxID=326968 RepID=A0ABM3IRU4_ZIZJJ|nr:phloretin 4'-O-glucosyltransferase [Ziziphus jujuba]
MVKPRFILVTFPAQGHINPSIQFAKRLTAIGAEVTLVTSLSAYRHMSKGSTPAGLSFSPFSDGYDDGLKPSDDYLHFRSEMTSRGSRALSDLIVSAENEGRPFTCLIYTLLLSWPPLVAQELHVPSAMLWIQPATVFDIYYYYFHGYGDTIREKIENPSYSIELPGLPLQLTGRDLPSFFDASNNYPFAMPSFKEQFDFLDKETNQKMLVNTLDDLEPEALRAIGKFNMIAIGPLTPSAFLGGKDPSDKAFGCDLFKRSKDYNQWLNSKPKGSVIYVSFGSICVLSKRQMEEVGYALLDSGRPFLWVIREKVKKDEDDDDDEQELSFREELEKLGMIVPWCSQLEVLSNNSLGCFMTHCGWNSTLESLGSGLPVVAFPQWSDQGTNAKLIEDVWKTGMRVKANKEGIIERDEIKKCLELVMGDGEKGEEIRRNAKKWKDLVREASKEGGSSERNLKDFVDEIVYPKKVVPPY